MIWSVVGKQITTKYQEKTSHVQERTHQSTDTLASIVEKYKLKYVEPRLPDRMIRGSHSGHYEEFYLQGHKAV
jgi:hypothetical protein